MKHAATRTLFAYWDECRGHRAAPDRVDIQPGAIRRLLGDTFILTADRHAGHPFRLAGTRICALFGRELRDGPFAGLWNDESRATLDRLIATATDEMTGFVAGVRTGTADGHRLDLELLVLPLRREGDMSSRLLGSLLPLGPIWWAGFKPLRPLALGDYRHVGPALATVLPLRDRLASRGKDRPRFVVHDGGLANGPAEPRLTPR